MEPEERIEALIEAQAQHNEGIRDLIVVSRAFLDSQKEVTTQIDKLRESQSATDAKLRALADQHKETEEKLHTLIDTVDRIIRSQKN